MSADEEREARLKAQLRLNLRRRKQKARAAVSGEGSTTADEANDGGNAPPTGDAQGQQS